MNTLYQLDPHERLFKNQLKILNKNLLISIPANLICATVVAVTLYLVSKESYIWNWYTATILISILRLASLWWYHYSPKYKTFHYRIFMFGLLVSASLWGLLDSYLMPHNILEQMVVIIIIAGITSGGLQTLHANLAAGVLYVTIIIVPLCVWLFMHAEMTFFAIGITMTIYLIFMIATSIRGYLILKTTLNIRYENAALIDKLYAANKQLRQSNQLLEEHEHKMNLINDMNDLLQTCSNLQEAYSIILFSSKQIFIEFNGGLFVLDDKILKKLGEWGNDGILNLSFKIDDCWALRKRRFYSAIKSYNDYYCYHFNSKPNVYVCIPLITQSSIYGSIVLYTNKESYISSYQWQIITSFFEVVQLSLYNIKLRETLYDKSIHDPLTNLYNRRYLDEILDKNLFQIADTQKTLCVSMIDIDFFKRFNDENGHDAGDEALKFIGSILNAHFNEKNAQQPSIACRFGGEEFIVILMNTVLSEAHQRLEKVRIAIKNECIHYNDHILPPITVSIGIAEAPSQGKCAKDIINAADQAMYIAKKTGKDKVISQTSRDIEA